MTKDLIGAIYEDPSDRAARSVLADELNERGDPRGELIALQLARADGRGGDLARETALIAKHGKKWMGALGKFFREPVFEDGFFAGGTLAGLPMKQLEKTLQDPAWRVVTVLAPDLSSPRNRCRTELDVLALVERPELVSLRSIYGVAEGAAAAIAISGPRSLTELGVVDCHHSDHDAIARCRELPKLRTLAIELQKDTVEWLLEAPVLRRIERLVVSGVGDLATLLPALAAIKGPLREVVICTGAGLPSNAEEWTLRLERDRGPGPFTRVQGTYRTPKKGGKTLLAAALHTPLKAIPSKWLTSIVLETKSGKVTLPPDDRRELDELLARFSAATSVSTPWAPAPAQVQPAGSKYELRLSGPVGLLASKTFGAVWKLFAEELGQRYEAFSVGNAHRKLTSMKDLEKWAANPRCRELQLLGETTDAKLTIDRSSDIASMATATLVGVSKDTAALRDWLARVVDLAPFEEGSLEGEGAPLVFVGAPRAKLLSDADLKKISSFVRKTRHGFLIEGEPEKLDQKLKEIVGRNFVRERGWEVADLAGKHLGALASRLGFKPAKSAEPITTALFTNGDRSIAVVVRDLEWDGRGVEVELRLEVSKNGYRNEVIVTDDKAKTRAEIEKQLTLAAKKLSDGAEKAFARLEKAARKK